MNYGMDYKRTNQISMATKVSLQGLFKVKWQSSHHELIITFLYA
jgi:hypothetical protein